MKICAIVAEFNPFHLGHGFLIENARKNYDAIIAIMSGNFVQRGGVSVNDKNHRAKCAIKSGCDLVIELPVVYAQSFAENFAFGAIRTLEALNIPCDLLFGSECGNIDALKNVSKFLSDESNEFKNILKNNLDSGMSYISARQDAVSSLTGFDSEILSCPNNILGVEYIKALSKDSLLNPVTIKRNDSFLSAKTIRENIKLGKDMIASAPCLSKNTVFDSDFEELILYRVMTASKESLLVYQDSDEELISRILKSKATGSLDSLIEDVKCRHFTRSRIRRFLFNMLIENRIEPFVTPEYIRPLFHNDTGKSILKEVKSVSSLPIASRIADIKDSRIFKTELIADRVYNLKAMH